MSIKRVLVVTLPMVLIVVVLQLGSLTTPHLSASSVRAELPENWFFSHRKIGEASFQSPDWALVSHDVDDAGRTHYVYAEYGESVIVDGIPRPESVALIYEISSESMIVSETLIVLENEYINSPKIVLDVDEQPHVTYLTGLSPDYSQYYLPVDEQNPSPQLVDSNLQSSRQLWVDSTGIKLLYEKQDAVFEARFETSGWTRAQVSVECDDLNQYVVRINEEYAHLIYSCVEGPQQTSWYYTFRNGINWSASRWLAEFATGYYPRVLELDFKSNGVPFLVYYNGVGLHGDAPYLFSAEISATEFHTSAIDLPPYTYPLVLIERVWLQFDDDDRLHMLVEQEEFSGGNSGDGATRYFYYNELSEQQFLREVFVPSPESMLEYLSYPGSHRITSFGLDERGWPHIQYRVRGFFLDDPRFDWEVAVFDMTSLIHKAFVPVVNR